MDKDQIAEEVAKAIYRRFTHQADPDYAERRWQSLPDLTKQRWIDEATVAIETYERLRGSL